MGNYIWRLTPKFQEWKARIQSLGLDLAEQRWTFTLLNPSVNKPRLSSFITPSWNGFRLALARVKLKLKIFLHDSNMVGILARQIFVSSMLSSCTLVIFNLLDKIYQFFCLDPVEMADVQPCDVERNKRWLLTNSEKRRWCQVGAVAQGESEMI